MGWIIRSKRDRPLTPAMSAVDRKAFLKPRKLAEEGREERRHTLLTVVYALLRIALVVVVAAISWWLWLAN
jgi:hypothetical protein